jgi:hypothetical protein
MDEMNEMLAFVEEFRTTATSDIPAMEIQLRLAIGYGQRVGELLIESEKAYRLKFAKCLNDLGMMEEETETTRKAKLEAWTAEDKATMQLFKNLYATLKQIRMSLFQAIRTRREEPR